MVGEDAGVVNGHGEAALGAAEDAEEDVVEGNSWAQEKPAVEGAGGDLGEVVLGDEA